MISIALRKRAVGGRGGDGGEISIMQIHKIVNRVLKGQRACLHDRNMGLTVFVERIARVQYIEREKKKGII